MMERNRRMQEPNKVLFGFSYHGREREKMFFDIIRNLKHIYQAARAGLRVWSERRREEKNP